MVVVYLMKGVEQKERERKLTAKSRVSVPNRARFLFRNRDGCLRMLAVYFP